MSIISFKSNKSKISWLSLENMNYPEIIKSLRHFHENIIPEACCSPNWNEKSIAGAFLWANFCEQIYHKFYGEKEIVESLDAQIHQLTKESYCFKNLKQGNMLLCQSFLQNAYINKDFLQEIILKVQSSELDFQQAAMEVKELDTLCLELLQSLKFNTLQDSIYREIKAELFLDFLQDTLVHLSTENQYESQLSFVFGTLCQNQDSLATVLHVLLSDADSEIVSEIQDFAMNWILLKLLDDKNGFIAHFFWKQPPLNLRKIAVKFSSFGSYYIDHLVSCASSLSLVYENFTKCWKRRDSLTEVTLDYKDILKHFEVLLIVEDELCKTVHTRLSSLFVPEDKISIWHDIYLKLCTPRC